MRLGRDRTPFMFGRRRKIEDLSVTTEDLVSGFSCPGRSQRIRSESYLSFRSVH